jgi:maleate isomerase
MSARPTRWKPDGWDASVRVGVLVPHAAIGPEAELQAMAPRSVSIHATRIPFGAMRAGGLMDRTIPLAPVRALTEPPQVDDAAELLAASPLDVIAFANTGASYVIGVDGEAEMVARLERRTRGIPVLGAGAAVVDGLRALGVRRIAQIDPPWFDAELSDLGRRYFQAAGFDVVFASPCGLPREQARIKPDALYAWVIEHAPANADAIVIGGNGLRAVGVIAALEQNLERPVLTANQVLLWAAMRVAGADPSGVTDYGRLFRHN